MKKVASLRYGVIFKKAFSQPDIFKAFVKDFLGIELSISKVETEKSFSQPIGNLDLRFDLFAEDKHNQVIVDIQHERYTEDYDHFLHSHLALVEFMVNQDDYFPNLTVFTIVVLTSGDKHKVDIATVDFDPKNRQGKPLNEIKHKILYVCPKYVTKDTPEPYREWLLAIADSLDEQVDETQYQKAEIQQIFNLIAQELISPQERARMKDEYSLEQLGQDKFEKGKQAGKKEGIKEGEQKGEQKKALETARKMLADGLDIATIMKYTGLSSDELVS
jgi:predicted transposase/invertase (TIGR01784 family)